jgi:hypothetical protein
MFGDFAQRLVDSGWVSRETAHHAMHLEARNDHHSHIEAGLVLLREWEAEVARRPAGAGAPTDQVFDPSPFAANLSASPIQPYALSLLLGGQLERSHQYLLSGFRDGFRICVDETAFPFTPHDFSRPRKAGAVLTEGEAVIQTMSDRDVEIGRVFQPSEDFECIVSPHFPHAKSDMGQPVPGAFRPIHHLSANSADVASVNERIPTEACSLTYQGAERHRDHILELLDSGRTDSPAQGKTDQEEYAPVCPRVYYAHCLLPRRALASAA